MTFPVDPALKRLLAQFVASGGTLELSDFADPAEVALVDRASAAGFIRQSGGSAFDVGSVFTLRPDAYRVLGLPVPPTWWDRLRKFAADHSRETAR